jgi:hypothetical protein
MNTGIIVEYLRWLDNKLRGRRYLLLIDNFSVHEYVVTLVGGKKGLQNIEIK